MSTANQIFNWSKIYQAGGLGPVQGVALLPIEVHEAQDQADGIPERLPPKMSVWPPSPDESRIVLGLTGLIVRAPALRSFRFGEKMILQG